MKVKEVTWDDQDDYCVAFFIVKEVEYEINIRKCNNNFLVWINNNDNEVVDEKVPSLFEVNGILLAIFNIQINLPDLRVLEEIEGYIE